MPRYEFTGDHETVLLGLAHGVNAKLHRPKHPQPDESTVVVQPGDEVTTDEPYDNAHLQLIDGRRTAHAARQAPKKAPAKKAAPAKKPATDKPQDEPDAPAPADQPTDTPKGQE